MTPERFRQIDELYHAALDRDSAARAAFLAQACDGDDELRREVESLLAEKDGALDRGLFESGELNPGAQLGPYRIEGLLGAGGMGRVYKARDTRLGRAVAIKVASARFSDRFQREARAISALNHPNICTLYDVGPNYLVMELVEGRTLMERIKDGAIPLEESLEIATQIAAALQAAHDKGVTHRDLKPGNIMLNSAGAVKVLDFGLAKTGGTPGGSSEDSPTLTMGGTQEGVILGTAAYMAPEQALAREVDRRADVWAFGVVLHEMVTGKKLFRGDDLSELLAAVIKEEPELDRAPAKVRRLLKSCLQKDPKQRLQAIGDWRLLLGEALLDEAPVAPKGGLVQWLWPAAAIVAIAGLAVSLWELRRPTQPEDRPLVRLDIDLGGDVSLPGFNSLNDPNTPSFAISPDATRLAYSSGSPPKMYIRRLDQPSARELPGTQGGSRPFFSTDGQWVGFLTGNTLNKISVEGGAVVPLGDAGSFAGATWGEDGSIVTGQVYRKEGFLRFNPAGGAPETLAEVGPGEIGFAMPHLLPGGKGVLFQVGHELNVDAYRLEVFTLPDRKRKLLLSGGASAHYLPTMGRGSSLGHLIYVNKATMFAVPFHLDKLAPRGSAVPVLDDVAYHSVAWTGQFDVAAGPSGHGTLVYRPARSAAATMTTIQWVDPAGNRETLLGKPAVYSYPRLSPDGKRLAVSVQEQGSDDIWVSDPQRDSMTRLTFGGGSYFGPVWTPDGKHVVFTKLGGGIFQARADGSSQPQPLTDATTTQGASSFTPDSKRLAYDDYSQRSLQLWTLPVEEQDGRLKAGEPEQFLKSNSVDRWPAFSPDGRWLAYASDESGRTEVYVRAFPPPASGQGGKWQISNNGGAAPRWIRNGHDLLYASGDQIMAASYTVQGDAFVPETPRVWLAKLSGDQWDLSPDGKRVVVCVPVDAPQAPKPEHELVLLQNFFDELRRRVPVK